MSERSIESKDIEPTTALDFWREFLGKKHPEIIRASVAIYPVRNHGESIEASMERIGLETPVLT